MVRISEREHQALTPRFMHLAEEALLHSWWVIAVILLCYIGYEHALKKHHYYYDQLFQRELDLSAEKQAALALQHDLQMQINSQSDQAWVELTLMKVLGVVPEDQNKVLFKQSE